MKTRIFGILATVLLLLAPSAWAQNSDSGSGDSGSAASAPKSGGDSGSLTATSPQYVLQPGDVVQVKVYQEDDLTAVSRIGKDGSITMPLVGSVKVVSNSLENATIIIRDLLAKDYLVDPQVNLNVTEFAKRRFTVLGQVQKPGTYDMPADEAVTLLQAIATAGGYTRIANSHRITVQRAEKTGKKLIRLDAEALAADKNSKPFQVLADDVIVVGEKWL
ncbi:MAG TPA: polysaccharide biosynthesis/export family protein [Verrucomicrobiae bacterium]|nr:polysaccharide biosynthesis/export family protein [Verrucomicrobiae bacterium]